MMRSANTLPDASGPSRPIRLEWGCLLLAMATLIAFRLHAFDLPLENDECNYAYIGARLLEDQSLYTDLWDHQPPGVFVLFAGVIALFGDAPDVFRSMTLVFSLASLGLIFLILRRISGRAAAISGALLFAIVSSDPGTAGEGCNREIFMNTLILAAWYAALRWRCGCRWWLVASGLGLGLASVIKTIVAVHWILLAVWIMACVGKRNRAGRDARASAAPDAAPDKLGYLSSPLSKGGLRGVVRSNENLPQPLLGKEGDNKPNHLCSKSNDLYGTGTSADRLVEIVVALLLFGSGPAVLWLVTGGYFLLTHRWHEFYDAVFQFNLSYSEGGCGMLARFGQFFAPDRHPFIFDSALPLWLTGAAASLWLAVDGVRARLSSRFSEPRPSGSGLILLLVASGYITASLPARFWPHYYYLLIPALVIAVSCVMGQIAEVLVERASIGTVVRWVARFVLLAIVPGAVLITEYQDYLSEPLFGLTVKRYNSRDFWGRAQGLNVARVTDPEDKVFVFGNDAEIYYYARRKCASRFTMITGLQSGYAGAEERRRALIADLEANPPRLIVVLFDEPPFEAWKAFLDRHYGQPVGWDFHDKTGEPIMFVLARKDNPIKKIDWNWDRAAVGGWHLSNNR